MPRQNRDTNTNTHASKVGTSNTYVNILLCMLYGILSIHILMAQARRDILAVFFGIWDDICKENP